MSERFAINITTAPTPIGPYSQAIKAGDFVFLSGMLGIDLKTGNLVADDAAAQAKLALDHIKEILGAAGTTMQKIVKTTIFLTDLADFDAVNAVYKTHFDFDPPARSTIQVAALPKGARVEIEVTALCKKTTLFQ